jgi:hypothetical protein
MFDNRYEYEDILVILIDDILVININFIVKLLFPLQNPTDLIKQIKHR